MGRFGTFAGAKRNIANIFTRRLRSARMRRILFSQETEQDEMTTEQLPNGRFLAIVNGQQLQNQNGAKEL
jgi:hypothetical protein